MSHAKNAMISFPDIAASGFSEDEQAALRSRFMELASPTTQKLDRARFRDILLDNFAITEPLIVDRIFRVFDVDLDGWLTWEEFVRGLAIFKTPQDQVKFCFRVYDLNGDSTISKDEMMLLLRSSLVADRSANTERTMGPSSDEDDGVKELVDIVHKRLDADHDQKVNLADFGTSVGKQPLLLQCLGVCMPSAKELRTFLQLPEGSLTASERSRRRSGAQ